MNSLNHTKRDMCYGVITLFICITMLGGTSNILRKIPHIQSACEEYFTESRQSHITLL